MEARLSSPRLLRESRSRSLVPVSFLPFSPLNYLEDTRYPALRCRNALLVFSMNVLESMPVRLLVLSESVGITVNPFRQCHSVVLFLTGLNEYSRVKILANARNEWSSIGLSNSLALVFPWSTCNLHVSLIFVLFLSFLLLF